MLTTQWKRFGDHANDIITHVANATCFSHALSFSAGIKNTKKHHWREKKNQFLHLHDISAPSWEMEFINQGQISLCLALGKRNEGEKGRRKWKCGGEIEGGKEKGFWWRNLDWRDRAEVGVEYWQDGDKVRTWEKGRENKKEWPAKSLVGASACTSGGLMTEGISPVPTAAAALNFLWLPSRWDGWETPDYDMSHPCSCETNLSLAVPQTGGGGGRETKSGRK